MSMERKGMIRRFGSYNLQQLEQMKQDALKEMHEEQNTEEKEVLAAGK